MEGSGGWSAVAHVTYPLQRSTPLLAAAEPAVVPRLLSAQDAPHDTRCAAVSYAAKRVRVNRPPESPAPKSPAISAPR